MAAEKFVCILAQCGSNGHWPEQFNPFFSLNIVVSGKFTQPPEHLWVRDTMVLPRVLHGIYVPGGGGFSGLWWPRKAISRGPHIPVCDVGIYHRARTWGTLQGGSQDQWGVRLSGPGVLGSGPWLSKFGIQVKEIMASWQYGTYTDTAYRTNWRHANWKHKIKNDWHSLL